MSTTHSHSAIHPLAIQRTSTLTQRELEEFWLQPPGRPIICTDIVTSWPARGKWSFDFFANRFPHIPVIATDQLFSPKRAFQMDFKTFARYCKDPSLLARQLSPSPLYFTLQPFSNESELLTDFFWPECCDNIYASLGNDMYDWYLRKFGVLLIGTAGTSTPTHVDRFATHAWLAQLCGSKRFTFCAPTGDQILEAVLESGEMIIFPQGWSHSVVSLSPSISLSFNFVNRTNYGPHLLEIFRDLPGWLQRLDTPSMRKALGYE